MGSVEDILRRMADDPGFARTVEADPASVLGSHLSSADLLRIEQSIEAVRQVPATKQVRAEVGGDCDTTPANGVPPR